MGGYGVGSDICGRFRGNIINTEGLQKQIEKALAHTRHSRVIANEKKGEAVVCNEDNVNPTNFEWKWGEDDIPMADQCTCLGVEISKYCSWDEHKQN